MLFFALLLPLGATLSSCGFNPPVPQETMDKIVYDIFLARGVLETTDTLRYKQKNDSLDIFMPILEKYGVSRQLYDSTMHYYSKHPLAFNDMLDRVLAKIEMEREHIQDSIRQLSNTPQEVDVSR